MTPMVSRAQAGGEPELTYKAGRRLSTDGPHTVLHRGGHHECQQAGIGCAIGVIRSGSAACASGGHQKPGRRVLCDEST
jgi:hypothetical protein